MTLGKQSNPGLDFFLRCKYPTFPWKQQYIKICLWWKTGLRPWRHVIAVGLCTEFPRTYSIPPTASRMTGRSVRVFLFLSSSASLDWQIGFPASFLKDITQGFADFLAQHWVESGRRLKGRNWVSNLDSSGGSSYLRAKLAALWEHTEIFNFGYLCLR